VATGFLSLKLISSQSGFCLAQICFLVAVAFGGRILLARFTIFDASQFVLSVGLLATLWAFTIFPKGLLSFLLSDFLAPDAFSGRATIPNFGFVRSVFGRGTVSGCGSA
jgi:hypothetical protein